MAAGNGFSYRFPPFPTFLFLWYQNFIVCKLLYEVLWSVISPFCPPHKTPLWYDGLSWFSVVFLPLFVVYSPSKMNCLVNFM